MSPWKHTKHLPADFSSMCKCSSPKLAPAYLAVFIFVILFAMHCRFECSLHCSSIISWSCSSRPRAYFVCAHLLQYVHHFPVLFSMCSPRSSHLPTRTVYFRDIVHNALLTWCAHFTVLESSHLASCSQPSGILRTVFCVLSCCNVSITLRSTPLYLELYQAGARLLSTVFVCFPILCL